MKLIKMIAYVMIVCSVVMINGCTKDNIDKTGQSTSSNQSDRGGLAFKVQNGSADPMAGVTISIAASKGDLDNGVYTAIRITDGRGYVNFGLMNPGYYYYRADVIVHDKTFHGEGVVLVQRHLNVVQTLTLR